jgi:rubrerythrin
MTNEMTTDNMSNEEVIEVLKGIVFGGFDRTTLKERQALDRAIKALKERPHGKWISQFDYSQQHKTMPSGYGNFWWCNKCDSSTEKKSNFCPNCGADMRGGAE